MTATIYFAGGEDVSFTVSGALTIASGGTGYRTAYARCGLGAAPGGGVAVNQGYITNVNAFAASSLWFSGRLTMSSSSGQTGNRSLTFTDSSGVIRLSIEASGTTVSQTAPLAVYKINAAGTKTQLGANFTVVGSSSPDKLDVQIVLNAAGTVNIYFNLALVFSYSGDTTTDGVTSAAFFRLYSLPNFTNDAWSEVMVSDTDARTWSMQTLAPVANGNTHTFDTGTPAAANINEITINDATLDGSSVAAQLDQYTIPAIATGTFAIIAVGVVARMMKGASGPTKADLNVRSAGTDYFSADKALTVAWVNGYDNWWTTDPATGVAWTALPSNIGIKSVA